MNITKSDLDIIEAVKAGKRPDLRLAYEWSQHYSDTLCVVRNLTDAEKATYAPDWQNLILVPVTGEIQLENISYIRDGIDGLAGDYIGEFRGTANQVLQLTPDAWDAIIAMEDDRRAAKAEKEAAAEKAKQAAAEKAAAEKAALLAQIDSWEITEKVITDEGGKTCLYIHDITVDDEVIRLQERNVFDFGRVINPVYPVAKGLEPGGIPVRDGEEIYWQVLRGWDGWTNVRPLTPAEKLAYEIVSRYGKYSSGQIRM